SAVSRGVVDDGGVANDLTAVTIGGRYAENRVSKRRAGDVGDGGLLQGGRQQRGAPWTGGGAGGAEEPPSDLRGGAPVIEETEVRPVGGVVLDIRREADVIRSHTE